MLHPRQGSSVVGEEYPNVVCKTSLCFRAMMGAGDNDAEPNANDNSNELQDVDMQVCIVVRRFDAGFELLLGENNEAVAC